MDDANLADLTAAAIARAGTSMAAWAQQHQVPYISLSRLVGQGTVPTRSEVLIPLKAAIGVDDTSFALALSRSREAPRPASSEAAIAGAENALQAALQQYVNQRRMTVKAFAEAADLSALTATKLLKHGELPGRRTTHRKLCALLGMSESEYRDLLKRSGAGDILMSGDSDDEAEPHDIADDALGQEIAKLSAPQRDALAAFLGSLRQ